MPNLERAFKRWPQKTRPFSFLNYAQWSAYVEVQSEVAIVSEAPPRCTTRVRTKVTSYNSSSYEIVLMTHHPSSWKDGNTKLFLTAMVPAR